MSVCEGCDVREQQWEHRERMVFNNTAEIGSDRVGDPLGAWWWAEIQVSRVMSRFGIGE